MQMQSAERVARAQEVEEHAATAAGHTQWSRSLSAFEGISPVDERSPSVHPPLADDTSGLKLPRLESCVVMPMLFALVFFDLGV